MTLLSSKTLHDKLSFNCRGFRIVENGGKNHSRQWEQYNKRNRQKSEVNAITVALLEYNMLLEISLGLDFGWPWNQTKNTWVYSLGNRNSIKNLKRGIKWLVLPTKKTAMKTTTLHSPDWPHEVRSEKTISSDLEESNCELEWEVGHWNINVLINVKANKTKGSIEERGQCQG